MPRFVREKTIRESERIFATKSGKALGFVKNGKITFYPKNPYNLKVCANANADIKGLKRVY